MSSEGFQHEIEVSRKPEISFEVRQHREGVTLYIFKGLAVAVDTTGKNYTALPELHFGPYNNILDTGSLSKPEENEQGVDMQYASECIEKVAEVSGIHQFWFYPYGDDVAEEKKERREKARLRLFKRMSSNIHPSPEGHGYILTV